VSAILIAGSVLMPTGFLAGGTVVHGGDPNVLVALVPIGGALLIVALTSIAVAGRGATSAGAGRADSR